MLVLKHVEHGKGGGASQVVSTEGCTQLSVNRLEVGRYKESCHGIAVGDALGHGDEVGLDAQPLVGKELTTAAIATLYLVADEYGAVFLAGSRQTLCKLGCSHHTATDALDALQDHGAHIALGQFALPCLQVVHGQEGHMTVVVDGSHNLWVARHLYSQRCAAVEGVVDREHARAPIGEAGQLQRVLVGLGATVDEKQLVVVVAADGAQALGQLLLQRVDDTVGVEAQ